MREKLRPINKPCENLSGRKKKTCQRIRKKKKTYQRIYTGFVSESLAFVGVRSRDKKRKKKRKRKKLPAETTLVAPQRLQLTLCCYHAYGTRAAYAKLATQRWSLHSVRDLSHTLRRAPARRVQVTRQLRVEAGELHRCIMHRSVNER